MKVFIVGLPNSGKTTVARGLMENSNINPNRTLMMYAGAVDWVKNTFRERMPSETEQHFNDEYHDYLLKRIQLNPSMIVDNLLESSLAYGFNKVNWIVDGVFSPKDFCALFDYNKDMVVFLNRTDNDYEAKDYESIGISVMRDYCFWLASAGLLPKSRWLEYNFKIPGDDSESVKVLGSKNSVYIAKSITRVISHLTELVDKVEFDFQSSSSEG